MTEARNQAARFKVAGAKFKRLARLFSPQERHLDRIDKIYGIRSEAPADEIPLSPQDEHGFLRDHILLILPILSKVRQLSFPGSFLEPCARPS